MDPDGNYIESAWDAFSLSMGITSLVNNVKQGNWGGALVDLAGVAIDTVALATPLPGGASTGIQGLKALNKVDNVVDGVKAANAVSDAATKVDDLISSAGKLQKLRDGKLQGFVKGDAQEIFNGLIKGAEKMDSGAYKLTDGTIVNLHNSRTTGTATIDINKMGELFKIRIEP